ncbi:MAG: MFS transporter [Candidatus Nanopelagicales bacterium]
MSPVVRRVLLGNALSAIGSGLTMPLLIVYLGQVRGLGTAVAGIVVAYVALVSLAMLPIVGYLVDRFGPRPLLMVGLVVEATGVALLAAVEDVPTAFMVATVVAIGGSATWSPQSALLGRLTTAAERQRVFGIQFMLLNLGIGIGGIVAATIVREDNPGSFTILYLVDAGTYLLYLAVLLTLPGIGVGEEPREDGDHGEGGYREVIRDGRLVRLALLGLVLLSSGYGAVEIALPVFITIINDLAVGWVAVAYAINTFTIVAMQLFTLRLIRGRSRSRLMALVAVIWGVSWLLVGMSGLLPVGAALGLILLSTLIFAIGETLWAPIAPSLLNDLAPDHLRGRYNSVQSLVWGVSGSIGPAVSGLLLGSGHVGIWLATILGGCALAGVMAVRLRHRLTPALDGRVREPARDGTMPS